ncbi:HD-GYP domain-containing protein [Methylomonas koyamae]|uniref:HD-GYP domain-containing protein n=1 Tax=Methylomonas koyamae TaxID=702114 RepID=UPI002872F397|nr:HD domain-containing phosphohydrolase [Methylomonas koyamae]WNB74998.1 DUF3391 domain-containing protein [Methylomonas koyamae]
MVKKICVSQLRQGMYLCGTDRKWWDIPFLTTKFLIRSDAEIETLREYCREVFIDLAKGVDVAAQDDNAPASVLAAEAESVPLPQFYRRFESVLETVRAGGGIDFGATAEIASDLTFALDNGAVSLDRVAGRSLADPALVHKSVNVCLLALGLARHLAVAPDLLRHTAIAALLHDLGLLGLPQSIIGKAAELTGAERSALRQHVSAGLALLHGVPGLPAEVLEAVGDHHERPDGAGYPRGLVAGQIGLPARLVAVASVYEALISDRADRPAQTKLDALGYLYAASPAQFDAALVAGLIEVLHAYPPGCIVELVSGELALVGAEPANDLSRPPCRLIADANKQLLFQEQRLDLSDAAHKHLAIARVLARDEPFIELLATFAALERL